MANIWDAIFGSAIPANFVLASPNGSAGPLTPRALVSSDLPPASVLWSGIGNASADLTLANAGFNTTFNQTSAVTWAWANTTAAAGAFPAVGSGATHVNSATGTKVMTLNVNVGDCVVIFVASDSVSVAGGVTDNGSGGSNSYTEIGTVLTAWGFESLWVCLSAAHTATTVTANFGTAANYCILGATYTGVVSLGASQTTATGSSTSPSGSITTLGNNSLVLGTIYAAANITAVSGTQIATVTSGTVRASLQSLQVTTPASYAISGTIASGTWGVLSVELVTVINQSSPILSIKGKVWSGSSITDLWAIQDVLGSSLPVSSTLTFTHSGATGSAAVSLPLLNIGGTDAGISRLGAASLAIGNGTAGDFSGTLKTTIVNAVTGYQVNGAGTFGNVIQGNGTNFVNTVPFIPLGTWRATGVAGFSGPNGFTFGSLNSATTTAISATATEPLYVQITTSTLATVAADISQNDALKFSLGTFRRYRFRVQLPATSGIQVWVGLTNIASASVNGTFKSSTPVANFIGFRYDTGASDTKWQGIAQQDATHQTVQSLAPAIDTNGHDMDIVWDGTNVVLWIDGANIATISTNVPATSTGLGFMFFINNLSGTTGKSLNIGSLAFQTK